MSRVNMFLKKYSVFFLCFLLFYSNSFFSENELFQIEASISPRRLSKGQEGKVMLKITLKKGITISAQPQFIIEFKPSEELIFPKNFFTASDLEVEILKENGQEYLNLEKPLEIPFSVDMNALRGNHTLEGKIKYFACLMEEGVCFKTTTEFSASFYTLNRVYNKRK